MSIYSVVVKSLTCCMIQFCLHRSLINETPEEAPKEEVSKLISVWRKSRPRVSYLKFYPPRPFLSPMAQQPLVGQGLIIIEASRSHSDTPHSVGILWMGDQPVADTSTRQNTILTRDRNSCSRRDSYPQSQQASGRQTTP